MAKFKFWVEVLNGSVRGSLLEEVIEIPDEDLEGYGETGKERVLSVEWNHWSDQNISGGWEELS